MELVAPHLIVVLGLPGTGKTTFARALADHLGALHLNTDMLRAQMGLRGRYDEATKARIYEALLQQGRAGLVAGRRVVLDGTFYKEAFRDRLAELAREAGAGVKWLEITASPETVRQRVSRHRPYSEADFAVYQKIRGAYEPLRGERLSLASDHLTPEAMLNRALQFLGL